MKKRQIPHTFTIVFYIIIFCALLTWFVPGGKYVEQIAPNGDKTMVYQQVESIPQTWQVLSAFFEGFVDALLAEFVNRQILNHGVLTALTGHGEAKQGVLGDAVLTV